MAGRGRDQNRDVLDRITAVLETLVQERDVERDVEPPHYGISRIA